MPVSNDCTRTSISVNGGGSRWIGRRCSARTGPRSSTGWPTTLKIRPRVSLPTGTAIGAPVFFTGWPRTRPSVESIEMQRAVSSPRCCATSITRLSGRSSIAGLVRVSAVYTGGSAPAGNSTSTTGPMTCSTRPCLRSMEIAVDMLPSRGPTRAATPPGASQIT